MGPTKEVLHWERRGSWPSGSGLLDLLEGLEAVQLHGLAFALVSAHLLQLPDPGERAWCADGGRREGSDSVAVLLR